jgi:Domain of unknown function (DUF4394)
VTRHRTIRATAIAAALVATAAADAHATMLVGLTADKTLVMIDADQAMVVSRTNVGGINGSLRGIDVRPADGQLYGVVSDGSVVVINPENGSTMPKSTLTQTLPAGVRGTFDFNPAADRLRMIGGDGTNLRANVDDGTVTEDTDINFVQPNPFRGTTPRVIAGAYSNNVAGARATLLWDIDDATDALYLQIPPNNGTLNPVGNQLGIQPGVIGFDIETGPDGVNRAWLISGNVLYQVGLVSGLALDRRPVSGLRGPIRDLAVLPSQN